MKHFPRAFAVLCVIVAALSAHDAWAVGTTITTGSNAGQVLIEHWDGVQWSIVPGGSQE